MIGAREVRKKILKKQSAGGGKPWDSVSCQEGTLFLDPDESGSWENLHQEQIDLTPTPPNSLLGHLNLSPPN